MPHHDIVMGLKWLVRVEAQRVSPKCNRQLDRLKYGSRWLGEMAYTGVMGLRLNLQCQWRWSEGDWCRLGMQSCTIIPVTGWWMEESCQHCWSSCSDLQAVCIVLGGVISQPVQQVLLTAQLWMKEVIRNKNETMPPV